VVQDFRANREQPDERDREGVLQSVNQTPTAEFCEFSQIEEEVFRPCDEESIDLPGEAL
jgi:hypothetical protein